MKPTVPVHEHYVVAPLGHGFEKSITSLIELFLGADEVKEYVAATRRSIT